MNSNFFTIGARRINGFALPVGLVILFILGLLASSAMHSTILGAQLTRSIATANDAFTLAAYGIQHGKKALEDSPLYFPPEIPDSQNNLITDEISSLGNYTTTIHFVGSDTVCPMFAREDSEDSNSSERLHYEIHSYGTAQLVSNHQVQGLALCRTSCAPEPCIATESALTKTYWKTID